MTVLILSNASIVGTSGDRSMPAMSVLIEDGVITEVSEKAIKAESATVIDCRGLTLLPGLIDCHVHVIASNIRLAVNATLPDSLVAVRAANIMRGMLERGFTTVRDLGGADFGLVQAVEEGTIIGPRLVICGKALSQTGGHADMRDRWDERATGDFTRKLGSLGRLCDGVSEVRRACREEIKAGAKFIKIMANGGVASPNDPISFVQFSLEEIRAIVDEASNVGTYVAAHTYTDESILRCVEQGVRSLEHCNLVTDATATRMAELNAFACPTLVTLEAGVKHGKQLGMLEENYRKIDDVRLAAYTALDRLQRAGTKTAFGTDLTAEQLHPYQADEFLYRREVLSSRALIDSATTVAAELLNMEGAIGVIAPGAHADIIGVTSDPLRDIEVLTKQENMPLIMKGGRFVKEFRPSTGH
ncbi:amidohydrolase family protein [Pseudochelatococcus sp. B33]